MSDTPGRPLDQIPVTVLTGYLGAGKTTLLNRILSEQHGRQYAVVVNEFGEIGIDNDLVVNADEEVFEMNNGCICCTVRGDLIRIVGGLVKRGRRFDGIIIETTGLADPAPVAQTFFVDEDVRARTKLDSIVTVVDAKHIGQRLADSHEAQEQVGFADVIVLNKTDLVDPDELAATEARIRDMNAFAVIHRAERCAVPVTEVLGRGSFDLQRILDMEPAFLTEDDHEHDDAITSVSLSAATPLHEGRFNTWIRDLTTTRGADLLRYKGILAFQGTDRRIVIQGVHMLMDGDTIGSWPAERPRVSRLVLIGRGLDARALEAGFLSCLA